MAEEPESKLPKRIVRTITLTQDDLTLLDGIERVISRTGQRIKTDSKLIRAAINVAHSALNDEPYNLSEVAAKVVMEDGRTQSPMRRK
jgi:hypothetical protein|tara:strand:+ start:63 stop:326 length:264 start_codon:yes stop_codon:yes gene_type:complete